MSLAACVMPFSNQIVLLAFVQGHPNPEHFIWEEYLEDNGAAAVPSQAFYMVSKE